MFMENKGQPIEVDGRLVVPIFKKKLNKGHQHLVVRRIAASESQPQGLRIKLMKGLAEINGKSGADFIIWSASSPAVVPVTINASAGCEIKVWNVWLMGALTQAWIGNAGMLVTDDESAVRLECSDGVGEFCCSDLVVQLEWS